MINRQITDRNAKGKGNAEQENVRKGVKGEKQERKVCLFRRDVCFSIFKHCFLKLI